MTDASATLADWTAAAPYVPALLVSGLGGDPDRPDSYIETIDGTLVFADISGFTALSERLAELGNEGAERLTAIINGNFERLLEVVRERGGSNVKFGGDAMLLWFGGEAHAVRAVDAALAMQRAIGRYGQIRVGRERVRLSISIGVHSARYQAATAGDPDLRMQYFILGSEAARLAETEGLAESGEVLITAETQEQTGDAVAVEPSGELYRAIRVTRRASTQEAPAVAFTLDPKRVLPYLPPPVARVLAGDEGAGEIEAEHRKVSIAFISLRGVNELLDGAGESAVLEQLQQYVSAVVRLAEQHGGFLAGNDIDSHGLKLWVLFGAPVAREADAANALRLALALNEEMERLGLDLTHRIGLNSGFVFAGDLGAAHRRDYTVMGDAVNLSARLMAAAEAGQILLSEQIAEDAGGRFESDPLPPIMVKGKAEPIAIRDLRGERSEVSPATGDSARGTLFGRDAEIECLAELSRDAEAGNGRVALAVGAAGTGKSRLFRELEPQLVDRGWQVLHGYAYEHTLATPLAPWAALLDSFFGLTGEETQEQRGDHVRERIGALQPDLLEVASLLNTPLSLALPETDLVRSLDDDASRARLFELVGDLLRTASGGAALLLLIEDLHWADASSLELVNYLCSRLDGARVLVALTQRPVEDSTLDLPDETATELQLEELPEAAAGELVRSVLGRPDLPDAVAEAISIKCRGNPLFLEEVARSLRDADQLDDLLASAGAGLDEAMAALRIPDRVQLLLMSRIDALPSTSRLALRLASVLGATFAVQTLNFLFDVEYPDTELALLLGELVDADLITAQEGAESRYRFRHALIQDVAYESLLFARRRALHHQVAAYLEETNSEQLEPMYEALAHHYSRADNPPKAVTYTVMAGDKARRVFANNEAMDYYERGLEMLDRVGGVIGRDRSYIRERIGDCHDVSGRYADAAQTFTTALRGWRSARTTRRAESADPLGLGDGQPSRAREATLCYRVAVAHERNSSYDASLRWIDAARRALPRGYPLLAAQIAVAHGVALFRKGEYGAAIPWARRGLQLSRRSGDTRQRAHARTMLGSLYLETGQLKLSTRHRRAAVELYEELGDLPGLLVAQNNLGTSYQLLGDLEAAARHYEAGVEAGERVGNHSAVAVIHSNIGEVLLIQGQLAEAIEHFERTVATFERSGEPRVPAGLAFVNLSRAYQRRGDFDQASQSLAAGTALLEEAGALGLLTGAEVQEAELAFATGRLEEAEIIAGGALLHARARGMQVEEARALMLGGRVAMAQGRPELAEDALRESVALAGRLGADHEQGLALLELATLHRERSRSGPGDRKAASALRRAETIFRRLGATIELARVEQIDGQAWDARGQA